VLHARWRRLMAVPSRLLSSRYTVHLGRNHAVLGGAALIGLVLIAALLAFTFRPFDSRAAGAFNPVNTSTYSTTDPGSHPDISSKFALGVGPDGQPYTADDTNDYASQKAVSLSPSTPLDLDIPDGAILGSASSTET